VNTSQNCWHRLWHSSQSSLWSSSNCSFIMAEGFMGSRQSCRFRLRNPKGRRLQVPHFGA